jgi:3-hydroxyacyl-CoA dehydrogenase/enoyl-CoA hydratase/3-hydroxybutyryl-CoA epimerase
MSQTGHFETLSYRLADNGVAWIAVDVPGQRHNVLTPELHRELGGVARHLGSDEGARGAVIHSAKPTFMAGGDLKRIVRYYDMQRSPSEAYQQSRAYTESLRVLETCGKPVAVAVNGTALGGGLELALAGHHRVVVDDEEILLGLPEVTLGLIPGGGGTQRLPRLIGIKAAADLILTGRKLTPAEALALGVIDRVVGADALLETAEEWVLEADDAQQPWDRKGFRVPGGSRLSDLRIGGLFSVLTARIGAEYRHNYPAPIAALRCLFNGTTVESMDAALAIETREFSALTRDPVARNIIRTLFIHKATVARADKASGEAFLDRRRGFIDRCRQAYVAEGRRMATEGTTPAMIENVAFAAGMQEGPLTMAGDKIDGGDVSDVKLSPQLVRDRLMCAQVLCAANQWADGEIDAVEADLASIEGWGFPTYTGGVMSFIDTMGLGAFIDCCDRLADDHGESFRPGEKLRRSVDAGDRIYSPDS